MWTFWRAEDPLRHRKRTHAGQEAADLPPLRRSHASGGFGQAAHAHRELAGILPRCQQPFLR